MYIPHFDVFQLNILKISMLIYLKNTILKNSKILPSYNECCPMTKTCGQPVIRSLNALLNKSQMKVKVRFLLHSLEKIDLKTTLFPV